MGVYAKVSFAYIQVVRKLKKTRTKIGWTKIKKNEENNNINFDNNWSFFL